MQIVWNSGLVLEGGGMRGVFTSGVLDAFMKHEVYFNYVVAVSAGACNGLSYMSRQPRRARIRQLPHQLPAEPAGRPKDQHPLSAVKRFHRRAPFLPHYTAARFLRRSCPICPAIACAPIEHARPVSLCSTRMSKMS